MWAASSVAVQLFVLLVLLPDVRSIVFLRFLDLGMIHLGKSAECLSDGQPRKICGERQSSCADPVFVLPIQLLPSVRMVIYNFFNASNLDFIPMFREYESVRMNEVHCILSLVIPKSCDHGAVLCFGTK